MEFTVTLKSKYEKGQTLYSIRPKWEGRDLKGYRIHPEPFTITAGCYHDGEIHYMINMSGKFASVIPENLIIDGAMSSFQCYMDDGYANSWYFLELSDAVEWVNSAREGEEFTCSCEGGDYCWDESEINERSARSSDEKYKPWYSEDEVLEHNVGDKIWLIEQCARCNSRTVDPEPYTVDKVREYTDTKDKHCFEYYLTREDGAHLTLLGERKLWYPFMCTSMEEALTHTTQDAYCECRTLYPEWEEKEDEDV